MKKDQPQEKTRAYHSPLREQQQEETRQRILLALCEQLQAQGPGEFSIPAVARRAGYTPVTIYRHFGSREQLLRSLSAYVASRGLPSIPDTPQALLEFPAALFTAFEKIAPWIEGMLKTGAGSELRAAQKGERIAHFFRLLSPLNRHLSLEAAREVAAVVKLLLSVEAWHTLRSEFGLVGERAGRAVRRALEALFLSLANSSGKEGEKAMKTVCDVTDLLGLSFSVQAAARSGLLKSLLEGTEQDAEGFASPLGLHPKAVGLVMETLVASGLAVKEGSVYKTTPSLGAVSALMKGHIDHQLLLWAHAEAFLKTGLPLITMDGDIQGRAAQYKGTVGALGVVFGEASRLLAASLPGEPSNVLDVGCGSGVWGLAFALRYPQCQVTGADLPGVLEAFDALSAQLGVAERCNRLEGDMHQVEFSLRAYDIALVANVLRLEPEERARTLLKKMAAAVKAGGQVVVVDALAGGTPEKEVARATYALHLSMRTSQGQVHAPAAIEAWMRDAGLTDISPLDLGVLPGATGALVGRVA